MCQSDQLQQPDRLVQTIYGTPLNVESEFDRSAIWTTEADDVERPAAKSPPIQSQYVAMASETLSPRSPSLPKGCPTRPAETKTISTASRRERNKRSATKYRQRLNEMIKEAWNLLPDDEKRGINNKLQKLETTIGYFRKLQCELSQFSLQ
ncbi:MAG: hypothetical protein E6J34_23760 [Chloroflexi bacterium]|nr:MAG: hypothetical protein E6J34_23760 [Chloroflexota bacterium]